MRCRQAHSSFTTFFQTDFSLYILCVILYKHCFVMTSLSIEPNRIKTSIILNLVKIDCEKLFKRYFLNESALKNAVRLYEIFMFDEINSLFRIHNSISGVVLKHQKSFECFVEQALTGQVEQSDQSTNNADSIYMIRISIQKWLSASAKGKQFFYTLDIHSFKVSEDPRKNVSNKSPFNFLFLFNFQKEDKFLYHL